MSEFKVGDRVKIKSENLIGKIREISVSGVWFDIETRTNKTTKFYDISVGNKNYIVRDYDLELIESAVTNEQIKLDLLEQRIEKLEKEVFKPIVMHDRPKEKSLLTEDERVILRNLDKKWKWIARDEDRNDLHVYSLEPVKTVYEWNVEGVMNFENFYIFNHLFQFIKWTDKEPYNIEELLKEECEE